MYFQKSKNISIPFKRGRFGGQSFAAIVCRGQEVHAGRYAGGAVFFDHIALYRGGQRAETLPMVGSIVESYGRRPVEPMVGRSLLFQRQSVRYCRRLVTHWRGHVGQHSTGGGGGARHCTLQLLTTVVSLPPLDRGWAGMNKNKTQARF